MGDTLREHAGMARSLFTQATPGIQEKTTLTFASSRMSKVFLDGLPARIQYGIGRLPRLGSAHKKTSYD
jgi:hypothetical protein